MSESHQLKERIKTIRNLCETVLVLIEAKRPELLPTVLEIIFIEAQEMTDEHCVERE